MRVVRYSTLLRLPAFQSAINVSPSGAITRLDGYFYVQSVSASALVSKKATVLGCMVVESSANVSDLDSNTLKALLDQSFKDMPPELQLAMYAQIAPGILKEQKDKPKIEAPTAEEKKALDEWFKAHPAKPAKPAIRGPTRIRSSRPIEESMS